eukprot:gb/GECH01003090.1/.p1 GENE.gb/GECH01003090.1/~~gb/GECH01003090.1/.p1  ORF type:complete len:448 (+),score=73.00 gb/GECH01003090.1/:1-1344(+)
MSSDSRPSSSISLEMKDIEVADAAERAGVSPSEQNWKLPVDVFTQHLKEEGELQKKNKKVKAFYRNQNEHIEELQRIDNFNHSFDPLDEEEPLIGRSTLPEHRDFSVDRNELDRNQNTSTRRFQSLGMAHVAVALSFFCNIILFIVKLGVSIYTGSMAVVASTLDSGLDLLSGLVLYITSRAAHSKRAKDAYMYPAGKGKMEPLGVVIFSCIMGTATLGLVQEAVQQIVIGAIDSISSNESSSTSSSSMNIVDHFTQIEFLLSCSLMLFTISVKLGLYLFCRRLRWSSSVDAYATDHRNDVITNSFLLIAIVVSVWLWWFDPLSAVLLAGYILRSWVITSLEQIKYLVGKTAGPKFLQRLTYLAMNHDERIIKIDTVRAFHFGSAFLVEMDIVLDEEMTLREAHDIGESLQIKLENLSDVERAFVHLDYEYTHKPEHNMRLPTSRQQ